MIFLALIFSFLLAAPVEAAKRIPRPVIGAPVGTAVEGGFALNIKDCYLTAPYTTATDTESSSGTMVRKLTGRYDSGQIGCPINIAAENYFVWVKARLRGVTQPAQRIIWMDTAPFKSGFQNTKATFLSNIVLPPATSFSWVPVGANLNMSTFTQGTTQATFALGSGKVLYLMGTDVVEFDCIFISTSSSGPPICPAGAPASGIVHNATGTAVASTSTTTLSPTITVAAGSDRILMAAVCHRASTNNITSVSSNVNGAFTLVNWRGDNDEMAAAIYRLVNPSTGAHTVTVTFSAAQGAVAGLVAYSGVSQTAPTSAVSTNLSSGNPSLNIAGAPDQRAIDHVCVSALNTEAVAVHSSQVQRYQKEIDIASFDNRISAWSDQQGDTSVAMDWTISGTKLWTHQALTIRPPSGAGAPPVLGSPSVVLLGATSARVEASVDDPSAQCEAEYDTNSGAPYANNTVDVGSTGGKCIVDITGLAQSTAHFYRINATNAQGMTSSSEGTFNTTSATAVTALGITQAEIDIWNVRRLSGPYRNTGDVSSNSPGDFSRILANANSMVSSPESTWAGQVPNSCWTYTEFNTPGRTRGDKALDAAFMYLLTGDTTYRTPVLNLLLAQAAVTGTNFADTTRWSMTVGCFATEPGWEILQWLTKLVHAYSYIRHSISAGNRATLDTWFLNAGTYHSNRHHAFVIGHFPGRLSDDYTGFPTSACSGTNPIYHGGPSYYGIFHSMWENSIMSQPAFFGLVGVMLNNSTLKDRAARSFKEWLRFNVFADGTTIEIHRGTANARNLGWSYAATMIGEVAAIADAFARTGDTSLYEYTTSLGYPPCTPAGGPKSLRTVILNHAQHVNGTITRYFNGHNGDAAWRIGPSDNVNNSHSIGDTYHALPNLYYNDAFVKSAYMRTAPGSPTYPMSPASGGYCVYCGPWAYTPGVLGMHGQMEGLVDPYP